jgi:hypothetical protein
MQCVCPVGWWAGDRKKCLRDHVFENECGRVLVLCASDSGLAIGLRAARDGANVVLCAKTTEENPKLPGTCVPSRGVPWR